MRWVWLGVGAAACIAATSARAGDLSVSLIDARGNPVADAVVTLLRPDASALDVLPAPSAKVVDQNRLKFAPYVETFRPGDSVVFSNSDETGHHVYSFSPIKAFEFSLATGTRSAGLSLPQAGVIAVGCNIHDFMIAYLYVSDAPWIARSDASGLVVFRDLPDGTYTVRAWHPRLAPGKPDMLQSTTIVSSDDAQRVSFVLPLLPDSRRQFDREATRY